MSAPFSITPLDPAWQTALLTFVAFGIAYLTASWFTPHLIEAAIRFGIVDKPDGKLKRQERPVAYLGGLSVALGVLAGVALTHRFDQQMLSILLAATILLVLGLIDDLGALRPWTKLAGQVIAALILVKGGVLIQLIVLPVWIAVPLTVLWMVAATNAFNLIDIMDGLSSGVGAVAAFFFAAIALANGLYNTAFLGTALAGALLGFRQFNVAPAKIYLGDTGSLFVGFLLGSLAMVNAYTREHELGVLAPLLILGVPLFDMLFVMWVRWLRGLPVMLGSPDHVALRLRKWRWSTPATVRANWIAAAVLGSAGVGMTLLPVEAALGLLASLALAFLGLAFWLKRIDMSL